MRKFILGLLCLLFLLGITGCETCKGFKRDLDNFYQKMKEADGKFQEEYW